MAWTKVSGNRISLGKQEVGTSWMGQYSKHYEVDSQMNKTGKQSIWVILNEDGTSIEFYGNASLDKAMKEVPLNAFVKIKLAGFYKTKFGKDAASVDVYFDKDAPEPEVSNEPDVAEVVE